MFEYINRGINLVGHIAQRFLPCKLATKRMAEEHLNEKLLDVEIQMSEAELQAEAEAEIARNNGVLEKWAEEDDAKYASDFDGVDWGQSSRVYRELSDERSEKSDEIGWLLDLEDFTTAAINAVREDPSANSKIRGIFEHCISPESEAICKIAEDKFFFDNVISDAAEQFQEQRRNQGYYDNPPIVPE